MSSTHENAVPFANENAVQLGNEEIVPLANENAGPLANQNAVSLANQNAAPLANQNAAPLANQNEAPLANQNAATYNAEEESLVSSICKTLNSLPKRPKTIIKGPTIFRVPANYRKNKECFIEPSVVSIGPYHHGSKHLAPMEDKKWLLLQDILSHPHNKATLKACVENIKGLQLQARSCYSERVGMDDDRFVEMLILDGTFIIHFLAKPHDWFKREIGWASTCIEEDLIMLENQIPFFVVQSLWDLYFPGVALINPEYLEIIGRNFCYDLTLRNTTIPQNGFHHLLHLCHHCVVPDMSAHVTVLAGCSCFNLYKCVSSSNKVPNILPCATELQNAGIKFRKKSQCKIMDVTFRGGTLEIPSFEMYDCTKPLFINLLAFEQSQVYSVPRYLSSYAIFMDSIINTENDVAILQRHGIIENWISGEEQVALFFNQLCEGASTTEVDYLSDLIKEVNRYYGSKFHRYRAKLMRDYFNSPWSLISVVAAVIILGLTFAQTYFAGDAYFHPSPK